MLWDNLIGLQSDDVTRTKGEWDAAFLVDLFTAVVFAAFKRLTKDTFGNLLRVAVYRLCIHKNAN